MAHDVVGCIHRRYTRRRSIFIYEAKAVPDGNWLGLATALMVNGLICCVT